MKTSMRKEIRLFVLSLFCLLLCINGVAFADGDNTLGDPGLVTTGSSIVVAGAGLEPGPTADINFEIPQGGTVLRGFMYWAGRGESGDTIEVTANTNEGVVTKTIIGDLIGTSVRPQGDSMTYRAPLFMRYNQAAPTSARLMINPGPNTITIAGLSFTIANDGAGVVVFVDDGSGDADIRLRDGNDFAYLGGTASDPDTIPQTFSFASASVDRTGIVSMFFADASPEDDRGEDRPDEIQIRTGGVTTSIDNALMANSGTRWDTFNIPVTIPAGASELTVQAFSRPRGFGDPAADGLPESFGHLLTALTLPPPPPRACIGRIGDFVFNDINQNGLQDAGEPGIEGVDYVLFDLAGNELDRDTSSSTGLYDIDNIDCPQMVRVSVDPDTIPPGFTPTIPEVGDDRSIDSDGPMTLVNLTESNPEDLTIDCGFSQCNECKGGIRKLSFTYIGNVQDANILVGKDEKFEDNDEPRRIYFEGVVQPGETFTAVSIELEKDGVTPKKLDKDIHIFVNGVIASGGDKGKIHTSCSRPINPGLEFGDFRVYAAFSKDNGLVCPVPPPGEAGADACTNGRPEALTFKYTGGSCAASNNDQGDRFVCNGEVDAAQAITIIAGDTDGREDRRYIVTPSTVMPGQEFTVTPADGRDFESNSLFTLSNAGGTQSLEIHTSCSRPLVAGDVFGSITLSSAVPGQ